jgi:hypothetical protein
MLSPVVLDLSVGGWLGRRNPLDIGTELDLAYRSVGCAPRLEKEKAP